MCGVHYPLSLVRFGRHHPPTHFPYLLKLVPMLSHNDCMHVLQLYCTLIFVISWKNWNVQWMNAYGTDGVSKWGRIKVQKSVTYARLSPLWENLGKRLHVRVHWTMTCIMGITGYFPIIRINSIFRRKCQLCKITVWHGYFGLWIYWRLSNRHVSLSRQNVKNKSVP